mmetsp:Transcript_117029/g.342765  ORF Transcript_117029/g.342765 Transcript_117029/m.342765 type:complete len:286 (-) Transcript_117029:415-1272(-)
MHGASCTGDSRDDLHICTQTDKCSQSTPVHNVGQQRPCRNCGAGIPLAIRSSPSPVFCDATDVSADAPGGYADGGSCKEEVGDLAPLEVLQEADLPVVGLHVGVHAGEPSAAPRRRVTRVALPRERVRLQRNVGQRDGRAADGGRTEPSQPFPAPRRAAALQESAVQEEAAVEQSVGAQGRRAREEQRGAHGPAALEEQQAPEAAGRVGALGVEAAHEDVGRREAVEPHRRHRPAPVPELCGPQVEECPCRHHEGEVGDHEAGREECRGWRAAQGARWPRQGGGC